MGTLPAEEPVGGVLSFAKGELDELLMVARWCAKFLADPPDVGYSDENLARLHEILARTLSELQSRLDNLRGASTREFWKE